MLETLTHNEIIVAAPHAAVFSAATAHPNRRGLSTVTTQKLVRIHDFSMVPHQKVMLYKWLSIPNLRTETITTFTDIEEERSIFNLMSLYLCYLFSGYNCRGPNRNSVKIDLNQPDFAKKPRMLQLS